MTPLAHPLVDRYLSDLETLLAGVLPADRAETMAGVREHIEASLPADHTDEEVRAVLGQLGSPQVVADEAYAGFRGSAPAPAEAPNLRNWMPVLACVLMVFGLLVLLVLFSSAPGSTESTVVSGDSSGNVTTTTVDHLHPQVGFLLLIATIAIAPFWVPASVLAMLAPTWRPRERTVVIALLPATLLAAAVLPWLGGLAAGVAGQTVMAWLSLLLMVGTGVELIALTRRALNRGSIPADHG